MTARDQHQADQIFAEAMDRPPASRQDYVDSACGSDDDLRHEVQQLLNHYASAEDALTKTQATHTFTGSGEQGHVDLHTGTGGRIGTCRLEGRLPDDSLFERWSTVREEGEQPSTLLLAHQRLTLEDARRVVIHAEALLRLDHPGLPRVLEAGTVDLGRGPEAFFLIRRADGSPLASAPATNLGQLRHRLGLLAQACEALQELHQHGLVHGRIDASRILVSDDNDVCLTSPGLLQTLASAVPGSPAAETIREAAGRAPERLAMAAAYLDARCDVFDLGRILQVWCEGLDSSLADQIKRIATRATSHDRNQRHRNAGELSDDLKNVLNPTVEVTDAGTTESRLTPMSIGIIALVAAVAGFSLGALLL
ncbi:MAG: protein kinase [Phycisphaerales bacterium]|nr:protein kinase [Phycisphaerales bacterium]